MLSTRLFWKILAPGAVLAIVAAALLSSVLARRERSIAVRQFERRLHDTAIVLRGELAGAFRTSGDPGPTDNAVAGTGDPAPNGLLRARLRQLREETGLRVTLILAEGRVLADSDQDPETMGVQADRPEIRQARRSGFGVYREENRSLGLPMIWLALRVGDEEQPVGFVRTAGLLQGVESGVAGVRRIVWGTVLAGGLIGLVLTYWVVGRTAHRLEALARTATEIGQGDFSRRIDTSHHDEVGLLAKALGNLQRNLAARIDALEQNSRQLHEESRRMASVLDGMIEGVIAVDASENILFANRAGREMLDLGGAVGRPLWEAVRNPTIQRVIRSALAGTEEPHPVETELPQAQSVVGLFATRLPGDPCPGVVLVMHDVTELRRLENIRREFVSNVSHELKTPLTAIQAYTETLLNGAIDDPEHNREFLNRIDQQAERLHRLLQDLLRLARIESGRDTFELTAVSLDAVVADCIEQHRAVAAAKGVTLVASDSESGLQVCADKEGLHTILDNLIDNAVKYTPAGGRVTVSCRPDGQWTRLEVSDTGVGIPAKHLPRIFERFYRVDKARSRELGGTGLGLSIVKHLVQEFGGQVEVESTPGQGSTFIVCLPPGRKAER